MKKLLSSFIIGIMGLISFFNLVNAQSNQTIGSDKGFGNVGSAGGIGIAGAGTDKADSLIGVIKSGINWMLGMLALIALVILLWGGFQMVTAAGDDGKYKKGFKILQQAAIGLVFIGVSWLVVSVIFWLLGTLGVK